MAYGFQVVVDAADPHAQADWWAETLGWEVRKRRNFPGALGVLVA